MSIEKNNKLIVLGEWKRNMRSENDIRNVDNNKWKESNVVFDYSGKNSIKKNVFLKGTSIEFCNI